ncbi:hypothetical protein ACL02R_19710 [Streptomyces sp. MS19]|uniref:hypothetical protein n=1 Tax=Streptomyces sp. MS19 TaxID=3385972 RepID=UPI0039A3CF9D
MTAVARYALADYLRTQRCLPPLVAYLGFLAVFHAFPGQVLPGYGASAAALVPVGAWLTLSLLNAEDPLQGAITLVNARGRRRVLTGKLCAALACLLVLTAAALLWPLAAGGHARFPADPATGLVAHVTCGLAAMAVATCCARPVLERQGYAFSTAVLLCLAVLVSRPLSPANRTIRLLGAAPPGPSAAQTLPLALWALTLVALSAALVLRLARHRR